MSVQHYKCVSCACGKPPTECGCPEIPSELDGLDADYFCDACRIDDSHFGGCSHHLCLCALPKCVMERKN